MNISIGLAISAAGRGSSAVAPPPPLPAPGPATLPLAPSARWHAGVSDVAQSGGRVVSASDLMGLANAAEGGAGIGPLMMTDALGRKFWRFTVTEFLRVAQSLSFSNRASAVFAVLGRAQGAKVIGLGNNGTTATSSSNAAIDVASAASGAPFIRSFSRPGSDDAAQASKMVAGSQLQIFGTLARTTANGNIRLYLNTDTASVFQAGTSTRNAGAEIGRYPFSPGASGTWGSMDLYELMVFDRTLTDAEGDAVAAALVAHWAIAQITSQLVLEGDSIMAGSGLSAGENAASVIAAPGAALVPGTWRVVSMASSGNTITNLLARRDAANSWSAMLLPGENVMAFEIGRNDFAGTATAAQHYTNVVAYLNSTTSGVLQKGWAVRIMANIATAPTLQAKIEPFRTLIRDPQFLTDTLSGPGQGFEGKVGVIPTDLIEKSPDGTIFAISADAGDTTYYQGDSTHPSATGAMVRVTGGDTPQYGLLAGLPQI